ncbi:MAG: hypothetical protein IKK10_05850 [Clostridia bacterium]|nr:hypothetical protein [Clostridia bacterium]
MNFRRTLSLALALILIFSFQCVSAFAAEQTDGTVKLLGSFNGWKGTEMETADGTVYKATIKLEAGNYLFKIKTGDTEFGHPGTVKDTTANVSTNGFKLSDLVNAKCTLVATGGNYTFSFDTETHKLKVIKDNFDTPDTDGDTLKVNFGSGSFSAKVGDTVAYSVYLSADKLFEDIQSILNYNSDKLSLKKVLSDNAEVADSEAEALECCPNISDAVYNSEHPGAVAVNASDIYGYDFTEEKVLVNLEFTVVAGGETSLEFIVQEMTAVDGTDYFTFSNQVSEGANVRETMEIVPPVAEMDRYRVVLSGHIALNFYMKLSDKAVSDSKSKVVFTHPDGSKSSVYVKDVTPTEEGLYMFTCCLAAKEMASDVKVQLFTSTDRSKVYKYSVKEYAEYILENAQNAGGIVGGGGNIGNSGSCGNIQESEYSKAAPLVKAMLNYGAYAQEYFGYNTGILANEGLSESEKQLKETDLSEYSYKLEGKEDGVTYYGSKLSLESETTLKHRFFIDDEENIPVITVNDEVVTAQKKDGYYEIKITGILAQELDEKIIVKVGGLTLDYNALSYAQLVMSGGNTSLKNVMKALCVYNSEADLY